MTDKDCIRDAVDLLLQRNRGPEMPDICRTEEINNFGRCFVVTSESLEQRLWVIQLQDVHGGCMKEHQHQ